jgi:hypothetical protein
MVGQQSRSGLGALLLPVRLGALVLFGALAAVPARAATFTVNRTDDLPDSNPGNGTCSVGGAPPRCTFRAALEEANALAGADTINFNIAPGGLQTISPTAAYPIITETVTIDGTTQPGYAGTPIIELNGAGTPANTSGLTLSGAATANSVIRGLIVDQFPGTGNAFRILAGCTNVVVAGNYIGTDPTGSLARPNAVGVFIQNATNNRIGGTVAADRNVISGNSPNDGIQITGASATGNVVQGNYIGLDASGTVGLGNAAQGVVIYGGASNNTVGGTAAGAGNVISGNGNYGVAISGASGNLVQGNRIGTNAAGTAAIANKYGLALVVGATGNTIGGTAASVGNVISGNSMDGIYIDASSSNTVQQNFIGTDAAGTAKIPNVQHGVQILNGASNNLIGGTVANSGNVISGNTLDGVTVLQAGTNGNHVSGNTIGLDVTGAVALGNTAFGVAVAQGASSNVIGEVGGRNIISGNGQAGVRLVDAGTNNNLVQLNYIGLDVTGTVARPNSQQGVILDSGAGAATGNTIGGVGLGNVISGNGGAGVEVRQLMTGTIIVGNLIGTNAAGTAGIGNGSHGVYLASGTASHTIGGTAAGTRNVISANAGQGVRIDGAGTVNNVVAGNYIGTDAAGTGALGNTSGGIAITNAAAGNTIGGTAAGAGNRIAFNATYGINVAAAAGTGNGILGNSIYGNVAELGIDLVHEPGVTANDLGDVDTGPNNLQNFPVLSAASTNTTDHIHIAGSLNSAASTVYRIEFFANSALVGPDPSGFGEGQRYLGFTSVTSDVNGNAVIGVSLPAVVAAGEYVTSTATDPSNNTSEFSAAVVAVVSLVVTTTANTVDGTTTSVSSLIANPGADGRISLREAILATNATAGPDTIRFGIPLADANHLYYRNDAIPGSLTNVQPTTLADIATPSSPAIGDFDPDYPTGLTRSWYRIRPTSALPGVTGAVVIDAETQPGSVVGAPVVELDGSTAGGTSDGLSLTAGPSTVRGLVVDRFGNDGLNLRGAGGFTVTGNYLGTDASGTMGAGNGASGIFVTSLTGATPTQIGGSNPTDRNVISGNGASASVVKNGIYVYNYYPPVTTTQVRIQGNYIGTDVTGTVGLGVQERGIVLEYTGGHLIGGSGAGEGNLISGNLGPGIDLNGNMDTGAGGSAPTDNNTIEGNRIGTNAAGTVAIPNAGPGIQMYGTVDALSSASGNTIRGNVIAASTGVDAHGIAVWGNADNNLYDGNFIGTDSGGTIDLGNAGSGIHVEGWAGFLPTGNRIQNNVIRFNDLDGVRILGTGTSATLTQNAISSNDALGIDLGGDGVTVNDALDADTGPNDLLNFPSFPSPVATAGTLAVTFGLDLPAGWYRIEFFKNPSGADPSGYGEGQAFASSIVVSHPGGGTVAYSHSFPGSTGDVVSATTTACTDGAACTTLGSTSEFSRAWAAVPTAVRLMSFTATGADRAVDLAWQTGSELDNLGFHLYRGLTESGPWTRLNAALIPGLGSSPLGASYSWHDGGLENGTRYYYRLEDVDAASVATSHGPVSAVPSPPGEDGGDDGGGDGTERGISCPSWVLAAAPEVLSPTCTRHGDPDSTSLQLLSRDGSSATLELHTGGFWALHERAAGADTPASAIVLPDTVRVFVPGLEFPSDAHAPALPLRRALVDAVVGRQVELVSAEALDLQTFPGLRPAAVGVPEMAVGENGTVRPSRRSLAAPIPSRGYMPKQVARLAGTVFQGERKSAVVEITPVRFAGSGRGLVLAGTVRVRLAFAGRAEGESGAGTRGRLLPRGRGGPGDVLVRLHTSRRGLHAVSFEQLFPQQGRGLSTAFLRLQRQGEAAPFHVEPSRSVFGPGSVLYFFAGRTALSTDYSSEVAYELVRSPGVLMSVVSGAPLGQPVASASTGFASFETNRIYQPGLLEAPDVWLWDAIASGVTRTEAFTLSGIEMSSGEEARLVVHLQGASQSGLAADHHVRVSLNGTEVGETTFAGKRLERVVLAVPVSALQEGANELALTNVGDTGVVSLVFLDRFEVSYPQTSTVREGVFEGVWGEGTPVEIGGLSGVPIVLRIASEAQDEDPSSVEGSSNADSLGAAPVGVARTDGAFRWLTGLQTTLGAVRFQAEAGDRYLVVSPEGLLSPRVERMELSTLRQAKNQADYLVIAPRAFLEAARPLLERRRGQGLSSRAVAFEEIAAEFGHGQPSAEAIREFLSYAYHSWQRPSPRYVLLLGDSSVDPRRFVATSGPSPLPALWTKTSYMWTVSDPVLAAVNGDDLVPDLAIGRLPATTVEEAERLVSKVLEWEESGQDLLGAAVLVADNPDGGGDFEGDVEDIRASFLSGRATTVLKLSELGAETRAAILGAFDDGASLLSYVGHGGTTVWASENVLNDWDVPSLRAQSRQPLLLTMSCLNGYFVAPNLDSLPEALLKAEGRGVVGAFSPSGLSLDGPAHEYHRALMAELVSGEHARLGDAILAAQRTYAETGLMPELLGVYHLLGDPATRIR